MTLRYALSWSDGNRTWNHPYSFACVVDAKTHAYECRPPGSTHYEIRRIGGEYTVKGKLDSDWQSIGDTALRVCADIRDTQIRLQRELKKGEKS